MPALKIEWDLLVGHRPTITQYLHLISINDLLKRTGENQFHWLNSLSCIFPVDALDIYDGGTRQTTGKLATAGIWSTYPFASGNKSISNWSGFGDQVSFKAFIHTIYMKNVSKSLV